MTIRDKTHHKHEMLKVINSPNTIQPNHYLSVASIDSSMTESTCIFPETLNKRINAYVERKQKNRKTKNMQTNSPPKLDTLKKISTPPKQNILVFSTHILTFHQNLPLFVTY